MYDKSKEKADKVLELYQNGEKLTHICEQTTSSQKTVKNILWSFGIDYDTQEKVKYQEKLDLVLKLYGLGKSQTFIEQELNLTRKTIRELIKQSETHYKTKSEQWRLRYGNSLKEDVFETITPESAYWIGMLYTDGHITEKNYNVEFGLHRQDREHLQKYLDFLECSNKIDDEDRSEYSRVRIGSERLHKSLRDLGFTNQKSYDAVPHESVKNSRDFWRGCIDGDGGIYNPYSKHGIKQISLCGTLDTICEFIWFCQEQLNLKSRKYLSCKEGKCLYSVSYYSKEAFQIADLLYKDATIFLDRKYKVYEEWCKDLVISEK